MDLEGCILMATSFFKNHYIILDGITRKRVEQLSSPEQISSHSENHYLVP